MKRILLPFLVGVVVIAAIYGVRWQIDIHNPSQRFMLPKPHEVLVASYTHRDQLIPATLSTLRGTLLGFASSVVLSVLLAVALSLSRSVRASLFPYLMILQMTPIIVVAPILLIWIGPGLASVSIITFLISFFPLVVNTTQGLISTDRNLVELFQMSRATRWQQIIYLRLPAALPYFFTGLRIAAVLAPIGAVVGDFFAGNSGGGVGGLGFMTVIYSANLDTPALFATAGICCALGFCLAGAVSALSWLCLRHWHESYAKAD
ncbi:MAG TPA: ABC transporter permease subunit [Opitutaceae bacterium]|nr:ABC transporter permease subunit [Opitutaceae bacterium]